MKQRFISVYLAVMQMADNALRGNQPAAGMALVAREEANLRAAMTRAFARGDRQQGWQMADTLRVYLQMAGRLRERDALTAWVREQMPTERQAGRGRLRRHSPTRLDAVHARPRGRGHPSKCKTSSPGWKAKGWRRSKTRPFRLRLAYRYLGQIYVNAHRPDLALAPARKAIEMFERLPGDAARGNLSAALGDLANAYTATGPVRRGAASRRARAGD